MGRYYNTSGGREGKFGFGCQPSTDPGDYFGMSEEDPTSVTYYADAKDRVHIKLQLDRAYDKLGVEKEKREYYEPNENYDEWINNMHDFLNKYAFEDIKDEDWDGKATRYASEKPGYTSVERIDNAFLWVCRVFLGIKILSDIKDDGYCSLDAEL